MSTTELFQETDPSYMDIDEDAISEDGSGTSDSELCSDDEADIEAIAEQIALSFTSAILKDCELGRGIKFLAKLNKAEKKLRKTWEHEQAEERAAFEAVERQRVYELDALICMSPEAIKLENVSELDYGVIAGLAGLAGKAVAGRQYLMNFADPKVALSVQPEYLQERREELFCVHRHQQDGVYSLGPVHEGEDILMRCAHTYFRAVHVGAILDNLLSMDESKCAFYLEQFAFHTMNMEIWGPLDEVLTFVRGVAEPRIEHIAPMFSSCPTSGSGSPGSESSSSSSIDRGYIVPDLVKFRAMIRVLECRAILAFLVTDTDRYVDELVMLSALECFHSMKRVAEQQVEPGRSFDAVGIECVCEGLA